MLSYMMNSTVVAAALGTALLTGSDPANQSTAPSPLYLAANVVAADGTGAAGPNRADLLAGLNSGAPAAPDQLDEALSGLNAELQKGAEDIQNILGRLRDLSSTTNEDAQRAADQAIGIGDRIDKLLEDGGEIDEAIRNAEAYFRGVGEIIARNDMLSESQRNELLDIINGHQRDLTLEANRLLEMRRTVQALTAKARQSREYLAMAFLAHTGERIVQDIQQLTETLAAMAAALRELTTNADTAAS